MKTNIFSVPMMYGIIKKMLPDDDFSFEVVSKSNDSISFKLYIFRPVDEQTGEFITDLIMADTFIQLLAKIEALFENYLYNAAGRARKARSFEGILESYCKEVDPKFNLKDAVKHIQAAGAKNIEIVHTYDVDTGTMKYEFCHEIDFGKHHWSKSCEDWEFPYELLKYLKENFGYQPQSKPESNIYKQPKDKGERSDD